jgi:hypothetical protein
MSIQPALKKTTGPAAADILGHVFGTRKRFQINLVDFVPKGKGLEIF